LNQEEDPVAYSGFRLLPDGHPTTGMQPSSFVPTVAFTGDDHRDVNHSFSAAADDSILSGVWECAPFKQDYESYPVNELMTILSGSVTITHADGETETFTAGDTFFIPKGAKCTWHVTETLRKYYLIAA
jgi:uncharacterized cupin superfamily protein